MINMNRLNESLKQIYIILNKSMDNLSKLFSNIAKYKRTDKIRITDFSEENQISQEQAINILNILQDMKVLKKIEKVYRCSNCGNFIGVLSSWDEGDDITCYNCNTIHPHADECDTETIYVLYEEAKLKCFTVSWLDSFAKDSTGNPLLRKADVIAYTKADAESLVREYYHYIKGSINVSAGLELENKMLLKEYN